MALRRACAAWPRCCLASPRVLEAAFSEGRVVLDRDARAGNSAFHVADGDHGVRVPHHRRPCSRLPRWPCAQAAAAASARRGSRSSRPSSRWSRAAFHSIQAGFTRVTLALVTGRSSSRTCFAAKHLVHKVVLAIIAWVVFASCCSPLAFRLARAAGAALDPRRLRAARPVLLSAASWSSRTCWQALGLRALPGHSVRLAVRAARRLVSLSAFFSSTETALMSINRYRLRHRAREGSTGARAAENLLAQPDRLIGLILVCNNFVNSAAAADRHR